MVSSNLPFVFENLTNLLLELTVNTRALKDATKPDGDAVNADRTLKDASEMDWVTLPTQLTMQLSMKCTHNGDEAGEDSDNTQRVKRLQVSPLLIQHILEVDNDIGKPDEYTVDDQNEQQHGEHIKKGSENGDGSKMESEGDGGSESKDDNDDGTKKFWQAVAQCKGSEVNPVRHHLLCT